MNVKKKLVILSDSLGRPRPDIDAKEATEYEDVYGYLLREKLGPDWIVDICYVESLDTIDAQFWSERMVKFRRPDVAIYHMGINDCAPRIFKKNSNPIIYRPLFKKLTFNFFGRLVSYLRYHITKYRKIVYVSSPKYVENLSLMKKDLLKYAPHCKVFFINIALTSSENDKRSFNYNKNISAYNELLKKEFNLDVIDVNSIQRDSILIKDGIHLTKAAHRELADMISVKLV